MFESFGHISAQMLVHVLLMNALAPLAVLLASQRRWQPAAALWFRSSGRRLLIPAVIAQLALLWGWHAPPVFDAVMRSEPLHLVMQASLLLCAVVFWSVVLCTSEDHRWRAILALLITSKLFCLLGALLVFAPRPLYAGVAVAQGHGGAYAVAALADQQLAGLLMLVACPVTYITAGIVIAACWLARIDAAGVPDSGLKQARHAV
jgi:putative membrane protein